LAPAPRLKERRALLTLSNQSAASEGLLDLAQRAADSAMGHRLEVYRDYLMILARLQIGRRLQGKVDPADVVQETFVHAVCDAAQFLGASEKELAGWLRQILCRRKELP
jgi:RNA polymerase sigma-70 factor (ECF subfamily)